MILLRCLLSFVLITIAFASDLTSPTWNWSLVNFNPQSGTDGFTALHQVDQCILLAAKRSSKPNYRLARADICKDPSIKFTPIGNIPNYTGAHTYYFDHNNSTIISSTGDVGNPCIIRSTDKGLTWTTVVRSGAFRNTGAVFSPIHLGFGEWIIFIRDDPQNRYIMRSLDDGLTWSKDVNTRGLTAGPRRVKYLHGKLYYSGTFASSSGHRGLYTSTDKGRSWDVTLVDQQIFAGVTLTSFGTEIVGEYRFGDDPTPAALWRRASGQTEWERVVQAKSTSDLIYFREVVELKAGHLIACLATNEDSQEDKGLQVHYSADDGKSWELLPPIVFDRDGKEWKVNAIYEAIILRDPKNPAKRILLAAAQPHDYILRLELDAVVDMLEANRIVIPKLRRWDGGMP